MGLYAETSARMISIPENLPFFAALMCLKRLLVVTAFVKYMHIKFYALHS